MNTLDNLFIFEMANNHQGNIEHGIRIIDEMGKIARQHQIKAAVKLQYRNLDNFVHVDFRNREDVKHIPRFMSTRLNYSDFLVLVDEIRKEGMIPMSTPFDEDGVDWCANQGLEIIKIASCSAMDWPLLEKAAATGKKLIISTGGKTLEDIDKIYNFFIHRNCDFALMHCVAEYPVPTEHIQLDFIDRLKKRYPGILIGYSGHEDPDDCTVPMLAAAKGAQIFERHVGVPTEAIKLNAYSMNPEQTAHWVKSIKTAKEICTLKQEDTKYISQNERDSLASLMRGVYVKRDISQGELIKREDVYFAMPIQEGQMDSGSFEENLTASKAYKANECLMEKRSFSNVRQIRDAARAVKALLMESGIPIGTNYQIELSHHYGMDKFLQYGAAMIDVINREYCKKLIVVLPGQHHPSHLHKVKEETFQLLYGQLDIEVDGNMREMQPGDILTVLRNSLHSFSSRKGAIFEEISTTHIKGDSYYEDEAIVRKDLLERKTIITEW